MFSFNNFTQGWNDFFYKETDASALCIFRVIFGLFLFINGISLVEDFHAWYGIGDESLIPLLDSFTFYRGFRINIFKILSPTESMAWFVLWSYIISSFLVMIGYKTRLSTFICFILLVSLQNRNYAILNSGDTLMRCMLFLLIFSPCQKKYSVDSYLKGEEGSRISILTIRLMQLQFSLVYLATTLFKLKGYDWVDGTAVYYTSRLVNFQRVVLPIVFDYGTLVKFATWSALLIEFAMGTLVWVKEFRIAVLVAGLLLHLGIEVSMSIGFFEWVMMAGYILFLEPKEIYWLQTRFKRLLPLKFRTA